MLGAVLLLVTLAVVLPVVATAVLAFLVKTCRILGEARLVRLLAVGTAVPLLTIAYGLYLSWPWPWFRPESVRDGLGQPGLLFVLTGAPVWAACLATSWLILRPRAGKFG